MTKLPVEILIQLENEKREHEAHIRSLEAELLSRKQRISQINDVLSNAGINQVDWHKSVEHFFGFSGQPLTTDDILKNTLGEESMELRDSKKRRKHVLALSLVLNRLCNKGLIGSRPIEGMHGKLYYPKAWETEQGFLMPEYDYVLRQKEFQIRAEKNRKLYV